MCLKLHMLAHLLVLIGQVGFFLLGLHDGVDTNPGHICSLRLLPPDSETWQPALPMMLSGQTMVVFIANASQQFAVREP